MLRVPPNTYYAQSGGQKTHHGTRGGAEPERHEQQNDDDYTAGQGTRAKLGQEEESHHAEENHT